MTDTLPDRRVIQCNYVAGTGVASDGARAYLVRKNPGGGNDRVVVLVRSRGGRWVEKWENVRRLDAFRMKTLPPEHPLYEDDRLYPIDTDEEAGLLLTRLAEAKVEYGGPERIGGMA